MNEPKVFLGDHELTFSLGFPYATYFIALRNEIRETPGADEFEPDIFDEKVATTYQTRLAREMEEATGFRTNPAPVTGLATAGPALINIDYLALADLLLAANVAVSVINNWADMAERVTKALRWLKLKAAGSSPVISDGVALILGSDAIREATGKGDLVPSFVTELAQYPPQAQDEPPAIDFDFLVGARSARWMHLSRVSDAGEARYIGRVRADSAAG